MTCTPRTPSISSLVLEGIGLFTCLAALALSFTFWVGGTFASFPPGGELSCLVAALCLSVLGWLPRITPIRVAALAMTLLCLYVLVNDLSYYQHQGYLRDFFFRCLYFLRS